MAKLEDDDMEMLKKMGQGFNTPEEKQQYNDMMAKQKNRKFCPDKPDGSDGKC